MKLLILQEGEEFWVHVMFIETGQTVNTGKRSWIFWKNLIFVRIFPNEAWQIQLHYRKKSPRLQKHGIS
jgi:hypothetical protein